MAHVRICMVTAAYLNTRDTWLKTHMKPNQMPYIGFMSGLNNETFSTIKQVPSAYDIPIF